MKLARCAINKSINRSRRHLAPNRAKTRFVLTRRPKVQTSYYSNTNLLPLPNPKMYLKAVIALTIMSAATASCSKNSPTGTSDTTATTKKPSGDTVAVANWGSVLPDTTTFYRGTMVAKITASALSAASGIAASRAYPGMFWIEDDKAGNSDIYLVDSTGAERAVCNVVGANHRDWTDMGIGPGPTPGVNYIYLADIGDSKANNSACYIYRVPEPSTPFGSGVLQSSTAQADKITFIYPNGPRDAETILIDPASNDLYILDKYAASDVYYLPYPQSTDTTIVAKEIIRSMPVPDGPLRAGNISSDRKEILMKSYTSIYLWHITPGESILDALLSTPVTIPITPEVQGEALCYTPDNSEFWTTSKFSTLTYADLDRYGRK